VTVTKVALIADKGTPVPIRMALEQYKSISTSLVKMYEDRNRERIRSFAKKALRLKKRLHLRSRSIESFRDITLFSSYSNFLAEANTVFIRSLPSIWSEIIGNSLNYLMQDLVSDNHNFISLCKRQLLMLGIKEIKKIEGPANIIEQFANPLRESISQLQNIEIQINNNIEQLIFYSEEGEISFSKEDFSEEVKRLFKSEITQWGESVVNFLSQQNRGSLVGEPL